MEKYYNNSAGRKTVTMRFSSESVGEKATYQWLNELSAKMGNVPRTTLSKLVLGIVASNSSFTEQIELSLTSLLKNKITNRKISTDKQRVAFKQNLPTQTRTQDTEENYERRAESLFAAYLKKTKQDLTGEDEHHFSKAILEHFVGYLLGRRPDITKSTFKYYRFSILFWLKEIVKPNSQDNIDDIIMRLTDATTEMCNTLSHATSATKAKHISLKDTQTLLKATQRRSGKYSQLLYHWIVVGIALGLRPVEVMTLQVEQKGEGTVLVHITNAKNSNGRATGDTRTINVSKWNQDSIDSLISLTTIIADLKLEGYSNKQIQRSASNRMRELSRTELGIKEKYPTIYTLRHQFKNNQEVNDAPRRVIADLMGHSSTATAEQHYGSARMGSKQSSLNNPVSIEAGSNKEISPDNSHKVKH